MTSTSNGACIITQTKRLVLKIHTLLLLRFRTPICLSSIADYKKIHFSIILGRY